MVKSRVGKKTAPYHVSGLRRLRKLVAASAHTENAARFEEEVKLATETIVPRNHRRWRETIRLGVQRFGAHFERPGRDRWTWAAPVLEKLLLEERAARAKRVAKTKKAAAAKRDPLRVDNMVTSPGWDNEHPIG